MVLVATGGAGSTDPAFAVLGLMKYNDSMTSPFDRFDRIAEMVDDLIEKEESYEIFLDASPWGILVVDVTFNIVYVNKPMEELSGYTLKELRGRHMHFLLPKEDVKRHVPHEKRYVQKPYPRTGNHGLRPRVKSKSGELVDVEISISPTRIKGKQLFFASIRRLETLFDTVEGKVKGT